MASTQRYVADELTHFVGRALPSDEARYKLLVQILEGGWLSFPPHFPKDGSAWLSIDDKRPLSANLMYTAGIVCFCDIPSGDLYFHMQKYGQFGIAFRKSFLRQKGANPVFYLDRDGVVGMGKRLVQDKVPKATPSEPATRGEVFQGAVKTLEEAFNLMEETLLQKIRLAKAKEAEAELYEKLLRVREARKFLGFHLFSHLKFFDGGKADEDPDNFYMEREWRSIRPVQFHLSDVHRLLIPSAFANRLREDVPSYKGQLTFAD